MVPRAAGARRLPAAVAVRGLVPVARAHRRSTSTARSRRRAAAFASLVTAASDRLAPPRGAARRGRPARRRPAGRGRGAPTRARRRCGVGPRRGHRASRLVVEAVREGYLLHYGRARRRDADRTSRCSPATGSTPSAWRAWPRSATSTRSRELADVIALCAQAHAEAAGDLAEAVWAAGAAAVGWGALAETSRRPRRRAHAAGRAGGARGDRRSRDARADVAIWRRPSVRSRIRSPQTPIPTRSKSKYTADRQIPGAFEGETVTRRRFMTGSAQLAGAIAAAAFLLPAARLRRRPGLREAEPGLAGRRRARRVPRRHLRPEASSRSTAGHRRGRQVDGLHAQAQPADRHASRPDQYNAVRRDLHALHAPRLPGALRPGRGQRFICPCHGGVYDFHGQGRRRPAGAPAGPLLHARPQRPTSRSARATQRQLGARAVLAARSRASRSTASASTSTRRARPCASSPADLSMPKLKLPAAARSPTRCSPRPKRPGEPTPGRRRRWTSPRRPASAPSTGSTSARRCPAPRAG